MAQTIVEKILAAIKAAGVDLGEDADQVTSKLDKLEYPNGLEDGQVAIDRTYLSELKVDLKKLRTRAKDAEDKNADLTSTLNAGDSENLVKVRLLEGRLKTLEPLTNDLLKNLRSEWDDVKGQIPESHQAYFTFDDKDKGDDGKINSEQLVQNMSKLREYQKIGAITLEALDPEKTKEGEGEKKPTSSPKIGPTGKPVPGAEKDFSKLTPSERMELGYDYKPGQVAQEQK